MVKPIVDRVLSAKGRLLSRQRVLEHQLFLTATALIAVLEDVSVVDSVMRPSSATPDLVDMWQLEDIQKRYQPLTLENCGN